jgi:hypothetical protein
VTLRWIDIGFLIALLIAGIGISYFFLLRRFHRAIAANQREMERRLVALTEQLTMHGFGSDESGEAGNELASPVLETALVDGAEATLDPRPDHLPAANGAQPRHVRVLGEEEDLPPEIQVAISAAAIAALGNHARVLSARRVPSSDVVSPWTQQGRVIVQSSHNLRTRG